MHEWALAESIIHTVINETKRNKLKNVLKITIRMGELQQIDLNIFKFALDRVIDSSSLSRDILDIAFETEKSIFQCKICDSEWSLRETAQALQDDEIEAIHFIPEISHIYIRCPACKSFDFDIIKGRGVMIESIEGET